jgi:hypothetical protein
MPKLIEKIVIITMQIIIRIILIHSSSICSAIDIQDVEITTFETMQSRHNNYIVLLIHIQEKHTNEYLL